MLVSQILREKGRDVVTVAAEAPLGEAVRMLARHRIGALVVKGKGGAVAGVLSERDIVRALAESGTDALAKPLSSVMTRKVVTCAESDTVDDLMETMTHGRFRHVPVVEEGHLVGIVSIGDVVKTRIEETLRESQALKDYIAAG